jgi:hypothetical protein
MKVLVLLLIFCATFQALPAIAVDDTIALKKCSGALNAFEASIGKGGARVKSDWLKGQRGLLLMKLETSGAVGGAIGSTKDISSCSAVGMSPMEINLFLMAYHEYLPQDPFEEVSGCFAALLISAPEMDEKLGMKRSQALGSLIGKHLGRAASQLSYLYTSKKSLEEIQSRAFKIQTQIVNLPSTVRSKAVRALSEKCEWYGIPLDSVLEAR